MSGRDVRRLAARATNMTHEAKRDIVARVAAGADAVGVKDIYIAEEPFRIASAALEHMDLRARVHCLRLPIKNTADDTQTNVRAFIEAGCTTLVSLGGDGTNRAIVSALGEQAPDITLMPLSTGTNNVFPVLVEPTIAGMAGGLQARGALPAVNTAAELKLIARAKVLHVYRDATPIDFGLIDAVLLRDDHVGNLLPFDTHRIERIVLSRAEPDSIGMSPIGGLLREVSAADDYGLNLSLDRSALQDQSVSALKAAGGFAAPVSPGLFASVVVRDCEPLDFDVPVAMTGPGVVALDGDRDIKVRQGEQVSVRLRRDGPWVLDAREVMRWSVAQGIMRDLLS